MPEGDFGIEKEEISVTVPCVGAAAAAQHSTAATATSMKFSHVILDTNQLCGGVEQYQACSAAAVFLWLSRPLTGASLREGKFIDDYY
eukprot:1644032-Rhodomonas_salina.3